LRRSAETPPRRGAFAGKAHLHFGRGRLNCGVEEFADIQCPYCGQDCEVVIDTSLARQRFTTDCEVCCRPFEVSAKCEAGAIVSVEVSPE
jgi:hypothetical protein